MQAAENVIVLNEGEDVTKLDGLQDSTLKELLKYQGDSSAFDIDDEKAILENLPTRLSVQQMKLLQGLFPNNNKMTLNEIGAGIIEDLIKHKDDGLQNTNRYRKNQVTNSIILDGGSVHS